MPGNNPRDQGGIEGLKAVWLGVFALLIGLANPAYAQSAEQLEQLEPDKGEWLVEYFGLFGSGADERDHSVQLMTGVTNRLAIGAELESSWADSALAIENFAPMLLYRFSGSDAEPLGVGLEVQASLDRHVRLIGAEARLIVEKRSGKWWGQVNLILRNTRQHEASATRIAYGWALNRAITNRLWVGLEGSGQAARLLGVADLAPAGEHFLGPALTYQLALGGGGGGGEVDIGIAYLARAIGTGPTGTARLSIQLGF